MIKIWHEELSNISKKAKIGDGTIIHAHVDIHDQVAIGRDCQIEAQVFIPNGVMLQDNVFVGPGTIFTNDPRLDVSKEEFYPIKTLVMRGARIGANCTIRAGVTIGENAIVGMGSVVLQDIPSGQTWVGNPARFLR